MCQRSFNTLSEIREIQEFIPSLSLPVSEHTALDIGLLCYEMSQNSLQHGGSPVAVIYGDQHCVSITDFDTNNFNPLTSQLGNVSSQGLKFLRDFKRKHPSLTITHQYLPHERSNVLTVLFPENTQEAVNGTPCLLTISGLLASRYSHEIEEQLRHLGHCQEIIIDINYGFMAYSIILPSFEAILRATSSRNQKVIIRTTSGDLIKDALIAQLNRLAIYNERIKKVISIQ